MKKLTNKRPIVVFAIFMIAVLFMLLYCNSVELRICIFTIGIILLVIGLSIFFRSTNANLKFVFSRVAIFAIASLVALGSVFVSEKIYYQDYEDYSGYVVMSGRVASAGDYYDGGKRKLLLDNVHVETDYFSKDLKHNAEIVVVDSDDLFVVGDEIVATAKISFSVLYYEGEYGITFSHKVKNVSCSGYVMAENISVVGSGNFKVSDIVKNRVEDIATYALDKEYAGLALGMLFGDDSSMNAVMREDFSATGIAHLLAVSGLHVGFLLTILMLLCKLFRIKGFFRFLIISILLIGYAYLCGFSVSVVRATIMCICSLYAAARGKRYDLLNSLSLSAIIVLILNPFSLSTVGFKLSYLAVLSIALISKPLTRIFQKFCKEKLSNTIATILAAQIGTIGIMIAYFNNVSLVAILANFVCIPVASFAYMLLFATTALSFVMPFLSVSVYLFQFVMQVVVKFAHLLARVDVLMLASWQGTVVTSLTIPTMSIASDYLFVKNKYKYTLFGAVTIILLIVCLI